MKKSEFRTMMAAVLASAMLVGSIKGTAVQVYAAERTQTTEETKEASQKEAEAAQTKKTETVYVKLDGDGNKKTIEASVQLRNVGNSKTIQDVSELEAIENVKGDEAFSQNGSSLVWNNDGKDICYQGTTNKALPVDICICYELDGKKVTAQELEGKSGHLKISYTYQNTTENKDTAYVPFVMVTGVILDGEHFSNVTTEHGKIVSDGDRKVVIGMGIPKLKENLGVDDLELSDTFCIEADVTDYEAIQGMTVASNSLFNALDTDKFDSLEELTQAMSQLQTAADALVDGSGSLQEGLDTLLESSDAMIDGISELAQGGSQLASGAYVNGELSGIDALYGGIESLYSGVDSFGTQAEAGINQLSEGAVELQAGLDAAAEGAKNLDGGIQSAAQSVQWLYNVADQLSQNDETQTTGYMETTVTVDNSSQIAQLEQIKTMTEDEAVKAQLDAVIAGLQTQTVTVNEEVPVMLSEEPSKEQQMAQLTQGLGALAAELDSDGSIGKGAAALSGALNGDIKDGADELKDGLDTFKDALNAGALQLNGGIQMLLKGEDGNGGALAFKNGVNALSAGLNTLEQKSYALKDGVTKLDDGAKELNEGMIQFNEEGIQKLVDAFSGDTKKLFDTLNTMLDASREYKSFSGISEDMDGEVKFIFVMDK